MDKLSDREIKQYKYEKSSKQKKFQIEEEKLKGKYIGKIETRIVYVYKIQKWWKNN